MAQKEPWISIPNTFLILWISIPVSCGSVSQTHFWFCGSVSLYPVDQYPKSISKRPLTKWSNGGQNSGDSQRVAQGLHRGCTGGARRAHRERTGSMQCPFYPTFLLFKLERWNLVSRMESWLQNHFKFLVARGHLQIPCGTRSFQILCGTRSSQIPCGTRSSQIFCGTRSSQISGGTKSFTNSLWHTVISNFLCHTVISNFLWHTVISNFW